MRERERERERERVKEREKERKKERGYNSKALLAYLFHHLLGSQFEGERQDD